MHPAGLRNEGGGVTPSRRPCSARAGPDAVHKLAWLANCFSRRLSGCSGLAPADAHSLTAAKNLSQDPSFRRRGGEARQDDADSEHENAKQIHGSPSSLWLETALTVCLSYAANLAALGATPAASTFRPVMTPVPFCPHESRQEFHVRTPYLSGFVAGNDGSASTRSMSQVECPHHDRSPMTGMLHSKHVKRC